MKKGELIKKYRKLNKLTQIQLGNKLNVSSKYISGIETSRKPVPQKLIDFMTKNFKITPKDLKILNLPEINKVEKLDVFEELREVLRKKDLELKRKEKELLAKQFKINTSDSSIMLRANIREQLIKINSLLEKEVATLESYMVFADEKTIKYFNGSLDLTINKMEKAISSIKKIKKTSIDIINLDVIE